MLLNTGDGIGCDFCGTAAKEKFVYYSVVFCGIIVKDGVSMTGNTERDIEICTKCYDDMLHRCRNNLAPIKPGCIKCDLCPEQLSGNIKYYNVEFAEVSVNRDARPEVSVKNRVMDMSVCVPCFTSLGDRNAI